MAMDLRPWKNADKDLSKSKAEGTVHPVGGQEIHERGTDFRDVKASELRVAWEWDGEWRVSVVASALYIFMETR
jgi:hypothetical protein